MYWNISCCWMQSVYVTCQRAKGAIEAPSSCCRSHIEILMVHRAVDKNNLVRIDEPRHRHVFIFMITLVHACVSVSLRNVRKSTPYIRYRSSIIRYPSTGKKVAIKLKFESHRSQSNNQEGSNQTDSLNLSVIPSRLPWFSLIYRLSGFVTLFENIFLEISLESECGINGTMQVEHKPVAVLHWKRDGTATRSGWISLPVSLQD